VADLYFNTPARRKFLRTEATEFGHCDEVFRRVALARPDVEFSLAAQRPRLEPSAQQELGERAAALLGREFVDSSAAVDAESGPLRLRGLAGSPQAARSRADMQYSSSTAASCATGCWRTRPAKPGASCCMASGNPPTCFSSSSILAA
jgi:DNA mismatch repair protein MutL